MRLALLVALPVLLALPGLAACVARGGPARDGSNVTARSIETRPGVELTQACVPTGPELCFNAVDDNCNAIIDEGCGIGTGALQFTIAWGDSPADVDLAVTDTTGVRVFEANRASPSGLKLDRDCPAEACQGQNIENVFFEGMDPPRGRYKVEVKLAELKGGTKPVRVRFGARVGNRSYGVDLQLDPTPPAGRDAETFTFTL